MMEIGRDVLWLLVRLVFFGHFYPFLQTLLSCIITFSTNTQASEPTSPWAAFDPLFLSFPFSPFPFCFLLRSLSKFRPGGVCGRPASARDPPQRWQWGGTPSPRRQKIPKAALFCAPSSLPPPFSRARLPKPPARAPGQGSAANVSAVCACVCGLANWK